MVAHELAQPCGIARRANIAQLDLAATDDRQHLLEMTQLLPRQTRHLVLQVGFVDIAEHQLERRPRRLFSQLPWSISITSSVLQGSVHPGSGSGAGEEVVQIRQHVEPCIFRNKIVSRRVVPCRNGRALYECRAGQPVFLICITTGVAGLSIVDQPASGNGADHASHSLHPRGN